MFRSAAVALGLVLAACGATPLESATNAQEAAAHGVGQVSGRDVRMKDAIAVDGGLGAYVLISDGAVGCDNMGSSTVTLQLKAFTNGFGGAELPLEDGEYVISDLSRTSPNQLPPGSHASAYLQFQDRSGKSMTATGGVVRLKVSLEPYTMRLAGEYELQFSTGETLTGDFDAQLCTLVWM